MRTLPTNHKSDPVHEKPLTAEEATRRRKEEEAKELADLRATRARAQEHWRESRK